MSNYWNSTFKAKPSKRKTGTVLKVGVPLRRQGKKAKLREQINRPNRVRFAAMGLLNVCEAHLPGCWPNGRLTWAHGKKDRLLTTDERKYLVIRCCTVCHHKLDEEFGHEGMLKFVQDVIADRGTVLVPEGLSA